jgi:GT2 family glycosyltransferase
VRAAVITIAAGRRAHLARQAAALEALDAADRVVVAMGDAAERERCRVAAGPDADVVRIDVAPLGLPLAAARNAGARRALERGAELLVFLDVDCLPGPALLTRYAHAAQAAPGDLLCGPVGYLPPSGPDGYPTDPVALAALATPHPARPVPPADALRPDGDHRLFWTLSFAVTAATWAAIGGFCEDYVGYGGEDTDFGQLARAAGVGLTWVGGAWAFHQHHATRPPAEAHAADILRNAALFRSRWGWTPMEGWLQTAAEHA